MYAPSTAKRIRRAIRRPFAGVCQAVSSTSPYYGWFVPYSRSSNGLEAVITLLVTDGSNFQGCIPFIVDTGAPDTIVPRRLTRPGAFPMNKRKGQRIPIWVGGLPALCHPFAAVLTIPPDRSNVQPLSFGKLDLLVAEAGYSEEYGLLGLDALRKVVMVSDTDHVCFWPQL